NFGLANGLHVVDTAQTGYIQRKMVKLLEDLQVTYNGTVEDACKHIISFDYGGDNFDGSKIIYRNGEPLFMDVESIVNKLNADHEWSKYGNESKNKIEVLDDNKDMETLTKAFDKTVQISDKKEDDVDKLSMMFEKKMNIKNTNGITNDLDKKTIQIKGKVCVNDDEFNNATLGFSFEKALCDIFNVKYKGQENINKEIVDVLKKTLNKNSFGDVSITKYIGEKRNVVDFEGIKNGRKINVSVKSSFILDVLRMRM
ncbi:hypothetical protein EBU94_04865, partial [bacterium]|nr:hypothetical protein [bacterium]